MLKDAAILFFDFGTFTFDVVVTPFFPGSDFRGEPAVFVFWSALVDRRNPTVIPSCGVVDVLHTLHVPYLQTAPLFNSFNFAKNPGDIRQSQQK